LKTESIKNKGEGKRLKEDSLAYPHHFKLGEEKAQRRK
jgi:hypothetical protein